MMFDGCEKLNLFCTFSGFNANNSLLLSIIMEAHTVKFAVAILAGGKSSRMGVTKASIRLASGRTLFEHVFDCARELDLPCIAVGHVHGIDQSSYADLKIVPDEVADRGPVGALLGLFKSNLAEYYLIIPCDQPLLTSDLLGRLLVKADERPAVFSNLDKSELSPLPGLYPASLLPIVESLLHHSRASLRELLSLAQARTIVLDRSDWDRLRSANTPQDVDDINGILRHSLTK